MAGAAERAGPDQYVFDRPAEACGKPTVPESPKRKQSWLALEWMGTKLFGLLPDARVVNSALSRIFYIVYNWSVPNLSHPSRFNEKMLAMKLSAEGARPDRARISDKELMKDHVAAILGLGRTPQTLAVIRSQRQLDRFHFPTPCVVKPTHSSQEVMYLDKAQPTPRQRAVLRYWLSKDYFAASREPNYRGLEKKLIVEAVIGSAFGAVEDIKVLCFHGRPKLIQVDYGRYREHRRDYYDMQGRLLPLQMRKPRAGQAFPFPERLAEIAEIAVALSRGFSFLRVDLYVADGAVLVGELTSFPTNCTVPFRPLAADLVIARLFEEPDLEISPALLAESGPAASRSRRGAQAAAGQVVIFPAPEWSDRGLGAGECENSAAAALCPVRAGGNGLG
jgi:hypothetical protein